MGVLPSYLTDHPSLVGVIRFPKCSYNEQTVDIPVVRHDNTGKYDTVIQPVQMATNISIGETTSQGISINKDTFTDFYPYTYYVLTDGETEPLIMYPQYLSTTLYVKSKFALSHQPIERYYPTFYKGSNDGRLFNITNHSQMMLPTATNEGMSYLTANASTISQNRKSQQITNILNGVNTVFSMATAKTPTEKASAGVGGVSNLISGIEQIKQMDARNKDLLLTPSSISSYGTPSTREKFGNNKVTVIKYTIDPKIKNKILAFISRYGNKYNNYDTINLKSYKGYIKFVSPNIDSKIDNSHITKIITILERGVYIE